jgi:hypothetical protein
VHLPSSGTRHTHTQLHQHFVVAHKLLEQSRLQPYRQVTIRALVYSYSTSPQVETSVTSLACLTVAQVALFRPSIPCLLLEPVQRSDQFTTSSLQSNSQTLSTTFPFQSLDIAIMTRVMLFCIAEEAKPVCYTFIHAPPKARKANQMGAVQLKNTECTRPSLPPR